MPHRAWFILSVYCRKLSGVCGLPDPQGEWPPETSVMNKGSLYRVAINAEHQLEWQLFIILLNIEYSLGLSF